MALDTNKNSYTVIFAAIMVVVVGSILAFLASGLRPNIQKNERFAKQQNILYAMGINENGDDAGSVNFIPTDKVEGEFKSYIKEQLVIEGDKITENNEAFLIDLKKQLAAKKKGQPYKLPLFVGEKDSKNFYIIPMYGKGLWDAIWGYIAVDDKMTVQGVYFVAKGNNDPLNKTKDDNEVDALAGATITGNGVAAMIKESIDLYKDYLETIRVN